MLVHLYDSSCPAGAAGAALRGCTNTRCQISPCKQSRCSLCRPSVSPQALLELLSEAANAAAYNSLLLGELPAGGAHEAANLIADVGLLGAPLGA